MKKLSPFQLEIEKENRKLTSAKFRYERACNSIQWLKASCEPYDSEFVNCSVETIDNCQNLPTIERICKKLRERYIEALNMPKRADHPQKVERISKAAELYYFAICKRQSLKENLKYQKDEKRFALQQMTDLAANIKES